MSTILIVYGTTEGHSAVVAQRVADTLRSLGHRVDVSDVGRDPHPRPAGYDGVVVGSSVHMSKHDKRVVAYASENRADLERLSAAFFSVSLAAHGDLDEAQGYVERFVQETGWRPARLVLVAGALTYTRYGFVKRHLMRRIARGKPGDLGVDMTRDYVYTEWDEVDRFARDVAAELASRAG